MSQKNDASGGVEDWHSYTVC